MAGMWELPELDTKHRARKNGGGFPLVLTVFMVMGAWRISCVRHCGSIQGAMLGGVLVGLLEEFAGGYAGGQWKDIVVMRWGTTEDPSTSYGIDCLLLGKNREIMGTRLVVFAQNLFLLSPLLVGAAVAWWKGPSQAPASAF